MFNTKAATDARKTLTGKDGALFNDEGVMLATVEEYQAQVNISNTKYNPLGCAQDISVPSTYAVTLSFTQAVIADDAFIKELYEGMKTGVMPSWNFQGVLQGRNSSEERVIYRDCVPSGTIDLQNLKVGEIVKRAWSFAVNNPPDLQSYLTV